MRVHNNLAAADFCKLRSCKAQKRGTALAVALIMRRPLWAVCAAVLCVASLCLPLLLSQATTVDGAVPPVNVTELPFELDGVNHTAKVPCDADGGSVAENLCSTLMANVPREPCLKVRGGEYFPFSFDTWYKIQRLTTHPTSVSESNFPLLRPWRRLATVGLSLVYLNEFSEGLVQLERVLGGLSLPCKRMRDSQHRPVCTRPSLCSFPHA